MRVRALLLATVAALLVCASPAAADVYNVTTTADGQGACPPARGLECTLREAVSRANANTATPSDTINVPAGDYLLNAQFGQLTISGSVAINGANAATTTIRGDKSFRIFQVGVEQAVTATLQHLTIADGATTGAGGNILVNFSLLGLAHVRVTGGSAIRGGGIALNSSTGLILRSLIDGNKAVVGAAGGPSGDGGGIAVYTNPQAARQLQILDSTITGNTAVTGAGLMVRDNPLNATTLTRSTIAFNTASGAGGGIYINEAQTFNASGSIVASNTGTAGALNCGGAAKPTSQGSNVDSV